MRRCWWISLIYDHLAIDSVRYCEAHESKVALASPFRRSSLLWMHPPPRGLLLQIGFDVVFRIIVASFGLDVGCGPWLCSVVTCSVRCLLGMSRSCFCFQGLAAPRLFYQGSLRVSVRGLDNCLSVGHVLSQCLVLLVLVLDWRHVVFVPQFCWMFLCLWEMVLFARPGVWSGILLTGI
jgi:hypothetical protein